MNNPAPSTEMPEVIDMSGARFEVVAQMGNEEADSILFRTSMGAGEFVPLHSHIDPECFYVLTGQIEVFVIRDNPSWQTVEVGHSLLLADGVKHAVRNSSTQRADLIVVTNNRLGQYFRDAGRSVAMNAPFTPPEPEDIERLLKMAKSYGYWIATPEENAAIPG